MLDLRIEYYVALIIIIYFPFHLLEEALGKFPIWMRNHKWIPEKITYGHWMANNVFFYYSLLLFGFISYVLLGDRFDFIGIGILFWGLINCMDHLIYSILDRKISPGLFTGLLYLVVFLLGVNKLYYEQQSDLKLIIMSLIMGVLYAFIPILLSALFHNAFKKIFI